jgi:hypothetical protein
MNCNRTCGRIVLARVGRKRGRRRKNIVRGNRRMVRVVRDQVAHTPAVLMVVVLVAARVSVVRPLDPVPVVSAEAVPVLVDRAAVVLMQVRDRAIIVPDSRRSDRIAQAMRRKLQKPSPKRPREKSPRNHRNKPKPITPRRTRCR